MTTNASVSVVRPPVWRYPEDAIQACQQAIELKPDYAEAYFELGIIYVALKDLKLAREQYNILKTLDENLAKKLFDVIQHYLQNK